MHATVRRVSAYSALRASTGWLRAFFAIALHPRLWWVAVRQVARMARPKWWRHAPFLPIPTADYLRFRLETAYGEVIAPRPSDLVAYLQWCAIEDPGHGRRR